MAVAWTFLATFGAFLPILLILVGAGNAPIFSVLVLCAGAVAFCMMALNMVLATRARPVEYLVNGLDRVYVLHKHLGYVIFIAIFFHATFDIDVGGKIVAQGLAQLAAEIGEFVYPIILVLIAISVFKRVPFLKRELLKYQWWRLTHRFLGVLFVAICVHQLFVKVPFTTTDLAGQYLNFMAVIGLASYLYTQFLLPARRRKYVVTDVNRHPAATVIHAQPSGKAATLNAGNFAIISLRKTAMREPHPFTVSKIHDDGSVEFSIKPLGDYTVSLRDAVEVGDVLDIQGGYGRFNFRKGAQSQIWLAGGIGITPFLAFADSLTSEETREIALIFCVSTPEEAIGLDRLEAAQARCPNFKFHLYVSQRQGRFNAEKLLEHVPFDIPKSDLWFCGPAPMRIAIVDDLKLQGRRPHKVHFEQFEFR